MARTNLRWIEFPGCCGKFERRHGVTGGCRRGRGTAGKAHRGADPERSIPRLSHGVVGRYRRRYRTRRRKGKREEMRKEQRRSPDLSNRRRVARTCCRRFDGTFFLARPRPWRRTRDACGRCVSGASADSLTGTGVIHCYFIFILSLSLSLSFSLTLFFIFSFFARGLAGRMTRVSAGELNKRVRERETEREREGGRASGCDGGGDAAGRNRSMSRLHGRTRTESTVG